MLTGNKSKQKKYYKHTGYPGGLKELYFKILLKVKTPSLLLLKQLRE